MPTSAARDRPERRPGFELGRHRGQPDLQRGANMTVGRDIGLIPQVAKGSGIGGQGLYVNGNLTIGANDSVAVGRNIPFGVVVNGNLSGFSRFTVGGLPLTQFFVNHGYVNFMVYRDRDALSREDPTPLPFPDRAGGEDIVVDSRSDQLVMPLVRCMKAVSRLISSSLNRVISNPCSRSRGRGSCTG